MTSETFENFRKLPKISEHFQRSSEKFKTFLIFKILSKIIEDFEDFPKIFINRINSKTVLKRFRSFRKSRTVP